jgi:hypothetical protein
MLAISEMPLTSDMMDLIDPNQILDGIPAEGLRIRWRPDIQEWIDANMRHAPKIMFLVDYGDDLTEKHTWDITFYDERDAVLFKMFWL